MKVEGGRETEKEETEALISRGRNSARGVERKNVISGVSDNGGTVGDSFSFSFWGSLMIGRISLQQELRL
jgi:hypothetical protein